MDMYGIVELTKNSCLTFYFVSIEVTESHLILSDRTQGKKPLERSIPLSRLVTHLTFEPNRLSFIYEQEQFVFIEYGNKSILYLSQLLQHYLLAIA